VLWIPAGQPPHKREVVVTPARVRLAMVRAAAVADPRFEVSTLEIDRPGASFMVDTVHALRDRHPGAELYLIVGADEFRAFDTWHEPTEIVRHVRLAVMDRGGESAAAFRHRVPGGADALFVPVRRIDVSSTEVRERRARGEGVESLVPAAVGAIIEREGLYSAS